MKAIVVAFVAAGVLLGCTKPVQVSPIEPQETAELVESVEKQNDLQIPYRKFKLQNGLTVILHQDHSDPAVHVGMTYKVGSADEEIGKTGFAHLFEHMMFKGSKHIPQALYERLQQQTGGDFNGATSSDQTNYYHTVPNGHLERILWIEADRMGFLLESLNQDKFDKEREVVKNERRMRIENRPYGRIHETIAKNLYPAGHPYSWDPIGSMADLERATLDDVRQFFSKWYAPNNAILTIAGDFNESQVLNWITKYFGSIPKNGDFERQGVPRAQLKEWRYVTLEDKIHLPLISITWPTVPPRGEDEVALDMLAKVLGGGKSSLLYKALVKSGDVLQVSASHPCRDHACEFEIQAILNPSSGLSLAQLKDKIFEVMSQIEDRGIKKQDVERLRNNLKAATIMSMATIAGKAAALSHYETYYGTPGEIEADLARYANVTEAHVVAMYRQYIQNSPALLLSVVPEGQKEIQAAAPNYQPDSPRVTHALPIQPLRITPETFDRSAIPQKGKPQPVPAPEYWEAELSNGLRVLGMQSDEVPVTDMLLTLEGGRLLDPKGKEGLASLTARLMNESTRHYSTEAISDAIERHGASISFHVAGRTFGADLMVLSERFEPALVLFMEKMRNPAFEDVEFQKVKSQFIEQLQAAKLDPSAIASDAIRKLLYKGTRHAIRDIGTTESLSKIQLKDVKQFYKQYVTPAHAQLIVVSNLEKEKVLRQLKPLEKWQGPSYSVKEEPQEHHSDGKTIYFIHKENASQSLIRFVAPGPNFDFLGDYFKLSVVNYPLGGGFSSILNNRLRKDKGITYGANSYFVGGKTQGQFVVATDVQADKTKEALVDLMAILNQYVESGPTPEQIEMLKSAYLEKDALRFEAPGQKAMFLQDIFEYQPPKDFDVQQRDWIESLTVSQAASIANKIPLEKAFIIVVGDKNKVLDDLKKSFFVQVMSE
ncbi:M16 family metallopeptidase [Algicola sagamiensis]|uniref:M16 family metallopeptidase n=1 Tax=Algicola sagamiensis TaxID=163869 RepID=UPI0003813B5A|nr:pitrilysin family protein [Algicola sagamiensis]